MYWIRNGIKLWNEFIKFINCPISIFQFPLPIHCTLSCNKNVTSITIRIHHAYMLRSCAYGMHAACSMQVIKFQSIIQFFFYRFQISPFEMINGKCWMWISKIKQPNGWEERNSTVQQTTYTHTHTQMGQNAKYK